MVNIGGVVYNIDLVNIIYALRNELQQQGKFYFRDIKRTNKAIQFTCPFHKSGAEKKASCGVLTQPTANLNPGDVHCFTCGYTAPFNVMVSDVFGHYNDMGRFGDKWLSQFLFSNDVYKFNINHITNNNIRNDKINYLYDKNIDTLIPDEQLEQYRFTVQYMYDRQLNDDIIEKFDVGYQKSYNGNGWNNLECITFPLKNIKGDVIQIIRRSIKGKIWVLPSGQKHIYGLYEALQDLREKGQDKLFVVESIFNCLTLWSWGYRAVAFLGLSNSLQLEKLKIHYFGEHSLSFSNLYICFDGDVAGQKASERVHKYFRFSKIIEMPDGLDVNMLGKSQFQKILNTQKK